MNHDMFQPRLSKLPEEIQKPGTLRKMPLGLSEEALLESVNTLNQTLVDTLMLANMYKKHHWQMNGPTFYQLHLLFDKHAEEQYALSDTVAERIQTLGGVAVAMPHDVAELTAIEKPPQGAETVPAMITRLLNAHEIIIKQVRSALEITDANKDGGSNDILMSDVLRTNELQVWFISAHLAPTPLLGDEA